MKKILLLILFTLLSFADQIFYERDDVVRKEGILYLKSNNKPLTGALRLEVNGVHSETPYKDGKIDGILKSYYKNGNIMTEVTYEKGESSGIRKHNYKSGNIRTETTYKKGKPSGISKDYYETGELKKERLFKNGEIDGILKSYYKNGNIRSEVPHSNGIINGHIKWYFETGELKKDMSYKNGLKDGMDKEYYKTGALQFLTPYKRGKVDGVKKWYYITGELRSEILMKDGNAAGPLKSYDKSGDLKFDRLGNVHIEDINLSTVKKLAKDYPVTERRCQSEHESVIKVRVARYLKHATPSFPEEGVIKFDYKTTSKYGNQPEFKVRIIQFMFKDSETCNRFLDEFEVNIDYTEYKKCKAKAHAKYSTIRDKYEDHHSPVVQRAYNIYLTKMKQCESLIKYPD